MRLKSTQNASEEVEEEIFLNTLNRKALWTIWFHIHKLKLTSNKIQINAIYWQKKLFHPVNKKQTKLTQLIFLFIHRKKRRGLNKNPNKY